MKTTTLPGSSNRRNRVRNGRPIAYSSSAHTDGSASDGVAGVRSEDDGVVMEHAPSCDVQPTSAHGIAVSKALIHPRQYSRRLLLLGAMSARGASALAVQMLWANC
jgi:hypothetical protein